ncbi:MAG: protease inhibitor I42 family protein [Synergistetes bacterium]|nr:protease inhibitor I42 family protein [Synergistota bacterium]MDW8191584.1 protease inhibitor I42 family protein [Synergistota bacterium]
MKLYVFLFLLSLNLFFWSFAFAQGSFNVIALKEEDSGREVLLKRGDILVVLLREVTTAGFVWKVTDFDKGRLLFLKSDNVKLSPLGVLGGTDLRIFVFRAIEIGKTPLKIVYSRPWEDFSVYGKLFYLELFID